jgi:tetratricopeptide (TPR) repeat protein
MTESIAPTSALDPTIADKILKLCQLGYELFDAGDIKTALRRFYSAWNLLPKPQTQWEQAGWVLTALGDAYFAKGDFSNGKESLLSALHCPKALGNPVIHLRLGQCLFELGETALAQQQLRLVRQYGGQQLIDKEEPKYHALSE